MGSIQLAEDSEQKFKKKGKFSFYSPHASLSLSTLPPHFSLSPAAWDTHLLLSLDIRTLGSPHLELQYLHQWPLRFSGLWPQTESYTICSLVSRHLTLS